MIYLDQHQYKKAATYLTRLTASKWKIILEQKQKDFRSAGVSDNPLFIWGFTGLKFERDKPQGI